MSVLDLDADDTPASRKRGRDTSRPPTINLVSGSSDDDDEPTAADTAFIDDSTFDPAFHLFPDADEDDADAHRALERLLGRASSSSNARPTTRAARAKRARQGAPPDGPPVSERGVVLPASDRAVRAVAGGAGPVLPSPRRAVGGGGVEPPAADAKADGVADDSDDDLKDVGSAPPQGGRFRVNARRIFLTYAQCDGLSLDDLRRFVVENLGASQYLIGREYHADGGTSRGGRVVCQRGCFAAAVHASGS